MVQLDAGYQLAFGDWQANDQYPHGMKWMADRIRELGLGPGIWVAPFEISQGTEVATKHPEWLVHDSGGNLMKWHDNYATWIQGDHYSEHDAPVHALPEAETRCSHCPATIRRQRQKPALFR